jgi:hypothetical protein
MSLLPLATFTAPGVPLYGAGGGGGGGGSNITASTITLQGSTDPLEITLPAASNDGFSVRQGGATNALAILTIDAANAGQAEFGIRSLSTISGNPVPRGRFEMNLIPSVDGALLSYTLDANASGNASTIGSINFGQSDPIGVGGGGLFLETEKDASLILGTNGYQIEANSGACLNPRSVAPTPNVYVPAAGTSQTVATFSTLTGHYYEMYVPNLRVQNQPAGAPAAGAWATLDVDTTPSVSYLDTFDMASVSSIANDLQKSPSYVFLASGAGHNLVATGSLSNTLSTAMTFGGPIFIRDLGVPANIQPANAAP